MYSLYSPWIISLCPPCCLRGNALTSSTLLFCSNNKSWLERLWLCTNALLVCDDKRIKICGKTLGVSWWMYTLYTLHYTQYTIHCWLLTVDCRLLTVDCWLLTPHSLLFTLHFWFYPRHEEITPASSFICLTRWSHLSNLLYITVMYSKVELSTLYNTVEQCSLVLLGSFAQVPLVPISIDDIVIHPAVTPVQLKYSAVHQDTAPWLNCIGFQT